MKKLGSYYNNETLLKKQENLSKEALEVKAVLELLDEGYRNKDPKTGQAYLEKLFMDDDSIYVLGTATEELCPGKVEVLDLLESDWEYWGDASFILDQAIITVEDDLAWFAMPGSVKYSFEHTQKRYDSYVEFVKEKANDKSISPEKRIALINWAFALTYHQRPDENRDYYCPVRLSGVMKLIDGQWKIADGHFSMPKGAYPDQRLEGHPEYTDEMKTDYKMFADFQTEKVDEKTVSFVSDFTSDCFNGSVVSSELYKKYFADHESTHVISADSEWHVGQNAILDFLKLSQESDVKLDVDHALIKYQGNKTWLTGLGTMVQNISNETLAERTLTVVNDICDGKKTSQEKLFELHRQTAYALKESIDGDVYTCPIRYSLMITQVDGKQYIEQAHFSYPYYWIFEGKLDTV